MEHKNLNRIIGAIVFLISIVVYGKTVAPTTSFWDCGEFITCSYILGVPHPPGAPFYLLVGRLFTLLPGWLIGDIGLRVNLISVIVSALTIMFGYLIIVRLMRAWKGIPETLEDKITIYTAGVIGALGFAFTDSFWFNAVEAEVYAFSMFFTAIVVWLILRWLDHADHNVPHADKLLLLIAYFMGLATGVHLLNILAIPTLFLIIFFKKGKQDIGTFLLWSAGAAAAFGGIYLGVVKGIPWVLNEWSFTTLVFLFIVLLLGVFFTIKSRQRFLMMVLMSTVLVVLGYSTYSMIYVRSGMNPVINENQPDIPQRFVSYLNREQYGDIPVSERRAPMWEYQIKKMYIRYFGWNFIGKGINFGEDGYISDTLSLKGLMGLPFLIGLIGIFQHFRRDWHKASAIMALFLLTGLAIVIYLNQEDPQPRERDYAYVGSFFAFAIWVGIGAGALLEGILQALKGSELQKVGASATALVLVAAVPMNLFKTNFESHDRSGNYVAYDYSYNILQSCEKDAILFTNGDNDTFPLWFLQYVYNIRTDVRVVNLSLLNTAWYIKQLRNDEPKVPITLNDDEVDRLNAMEFREPKVLNIKVPREEVLRQLEAQKDNASVDPDTVPENPTVRFKLHHTRVLQGIPALLVQDTMVLHIIQANKFRKPVYFAVTVSPQNMLGLDNRRNEQGFDNYLRMDGLTFRVMPYGGPREFIAYETMHENLFEKFQYRNLDNPDVYYNENIIGLLQNYRSAFVKLVSHHGSNREQDKAVEVLDKMSEVLPEKVIPMRSYQLSLTFARMYNDAGYPEKFEQKVEEVLTTYPLGPNEKIEIYYWLMTYYATNNQYDKSIEYVDKWLAINPDDMQAKQQRERLERLAQNANGRGDSLKTAEENN